MLDPETIENDDWYPIRLNMDEVSGVCTINT